ncbi:site-specific integrase [Nocardiopsis rhodophaea]|uniref:Site-specific integrase n=1 Tax=Nocardiopsis rhodophaea TaxID=280238 RepID=A0ABP5ETJ3_9ACTN
MTSKKKRRSPGEGSVITFTTASGDVRYGIKFVRPLDDGSTKQVFRRRDEDNQPWTSKTAAQKALRDALSKLDRGEYVDPSKQTLGEYLDEWVDGLRLGASTLASYRKNIRLHIKPHLGGVPLASLTPAKITALYRKLETDGRRDHQAGKGLSARTVRYIHTILRSALSAAVDAGSLTRNPADKAKPPTAKEAKAPEMHPWTRDQLRAFLDWAKVNSALYVAWFVLAMTGIRRGELLALRWRDIDLDTGTMAVRRSVGIVRVKGKGAEITEGPTKTNRPRVIDLDEPTVNLLRAHRRERGSLSLQLARDDALVFGDHEGAWRHPERFSRSFREHLIRCRKQLADGAAEAPELIRLHDLRHTHATVLLSLGTHPKIVSERLGHANVSITLDTYSHALPTIQRDAVSKLSALMSTGT